MTRIIKRLLIFFFLLLFLQNTLWANRVSGLYNAPRLSVKFGEDSPFSLLPIGWSKEGKAAFLILRRAGQSAYLVIIDTVDDSIVFQSEEQDLPEGGIGELWISNIELYSSKLSESSIIPEDEPVYGSHDFTSGNDSYTIYREAELLPGNRGMAALTLYIKSQRRGMKKLYSYVHNDESDRLLMDYKVLGFFKSPWERRVAVLSLEDYYNENGENSIQLKISGAHLTIGYIRDKSPAARLMEAVLSGQYYTTRTLLQNGADPDTKITDGKLLVLMAAEQENWDIMVLLLEAGANPGAVDEKGRTLLHYAARAGNEEAVIKLLSLGLNRNYRDEEGKSSGDLAREEGHVHLDSLLAE